MRNIDVYNRMQACDLLPDPEAVVISISGPGRAAPLREGWYDILRLEFHDIDPKWGLPEDLRAFDDDHAEKVFRFAEEHVERDMVIHCDAGVSRSVAVGLFISNEFGGNLRTHAIHTTGARNGHVLSVLNRRVWLAHFGEGE